MELRLDRMASPIGTLLLLSDSEALRVLEFEDHEDRMHRLLRQQNGAVTIQPGPASAAARQVAAYFDGDMAALDAIPVATGGTLFQRQVWQALRQIGPGTTTTYGRLAAQLGRPGASRAVGLANGANPVGIVVPCHRVVGAAGLTGYGGGLWRKTWLLEHEGRACGTGGFVQQALALE